MKRPRVGLGVFVKKDGKILVGKRKGYHGGGTWALPGGHLEPGESFESCCKREVLEETGLIIKNISPVVFTNDVFHDEGLHYITLFFKGELLQSHATARNGGGFPWTIFLNPFSYHFETPWKKSTRESYRCSKISCLGLNQPRRGLHCFFSGGSFLE